MSTAERIKIARINKGYTQAELGELIGVQRAAINKYENGTVSNLKRATIAKLASVLDVKPSWLLCIDNEQEKVSPTPDQQAAIDFVMSLKEDELRKFISMGKIMLGEENK